MLKIRLVTSELNNEHSFVNQDEDEDVHTYVSIDKHVSLSYFPEPTNVLAIVLGVLGGVAFLVVVAVIIILYRRRSMRKRGMAI